MGETLTIPARYNGPPGSANGGVTCGLVAGLVGTEEVEVTLRSPPALERPLEVRREGDAVELHDGDTIVAKGRPAALGLDTPAPVPRDEVVAAHEAGSEQWTAHHPFPTCLVCGPARAEGDGMRLFPVELPGRDGLCGVAWTPGEWLAGGDGLVRPELVWAALDCPTSAPVANFGTGPAMVLARLTGRLGCSVRVGEDHTVLSWAIERDGRKRHAAAALYDSEGRMVCASRALWIELRG